MGFRASALPQAPGARRAHHEGDADLERLRSENTINKVVVGACGKIRRSRARRVGCVGASRRPSSRDPGRSSSHCRSRRAGERGAPGSHVRPRGLGEDADSSPSATGRCPAEADLDVLRVIMRAVLERD